MASYRLASGKWPNPKHENVFYVINPIEANLPGHWVPMSILKKVIENRVNTGIAYEYEITKPWDIYHDNKKMKLSKIVMKPKVNVGQSKNNNKFDSINKYITESSLIKVDGTTTYDTDGSKDVLATKEKQIKGLETYSKDIKKLAEMKTRHVTINESKSIKLTDAVTDAKARPNSTTGAFTEVPAEAQTHVSNQASTKPPKKPPTQAPTKPHTKPPTQTSAEYPTKSTTKALTQPPTKLPIQTSTEPSTEETTTPTTVTVPTILTTTVPTSTTIESTGNPFY